MWKLLALVAVALLAVLSIAFLSAPDRASAELDRSSNARTTDVTPAALPDAGLDAQRRRTVVQSEAPDSGGALLSSEVETERRDELSLRGELLIRVETREGQPIDGADVRVASYVPFGYAAVPKPRPEDMLRATAVAAGRYCVDVGLDQAYLATIECDGFARSELDGLRCGVEAVAVLSQAASLRMRVMEKDGGDPIPGALVRVFHGPNGSQAEALTDAVGVAQLDRLEAGTAGYLVVPARHVSSGYQEFVLESGIDNEVTVQAAEGASLKGRVLDAKSRTPIAGASVGSPGFSTRSWVTDATGGFEVTGLGEGASTVMALAEGYAPQRVQDLKAGTTVEILMLPAVQLTGRAVDEDGQALSGVTVQLSQALRYDRVPSTTDSEGRFRVDGFHPKKYVMALLFAPGRAAASRNTDVTPLAKESSDVVDLGDFVLPAAIQVGGTLRWETGEPAVGAAIVVVRQNSNGEGTQRGCASGDAGAFRMMLEPGTWSATIRADGIESERSAVRWGSSTTALKWTIRSAGELTGTVLGPDDRPVVGAFVQAKGAGYRDSVQTDEAGQFRFANAGAGDLGLYVSPGATEWLPTTIEGVVAGSQALDIQLRAADLQLHGIVQEANGAPIPFALVSLDVGRGRSSHASVADQDGRFHLSVPSKGTARLTAWRTAELQRVNGSWYSEDRRIGRTVLDRYSEPITQMRLEGGTPVATQSSAATRPTISLTE